MSIENALAKRIEDFLSSQPPFDQLNEGELQNLSFQFRLKYVSKEDWLFQQGEECHDDLFIVRTGLIEIIDPANRILDLCDEGDIIGARSLFEGKRYLAGAQVREGGIVYLINIKFLKPLLSDNSSFAHFFYKGLAAGRYQDPTTDEFATNPQVLSRPFDFNQLPSPLLLTLNTSIKEAAIQMSENDSSASLILNENKEPIGIVTDRDLRRKVATGAFAIEHPVQDIMSSPVHCAQKGLTEAHYQAVLLEAGFRHLCITEDGTSASRALYILSEHDILVQRTDNPAVFLRHLRKLSLNELPNWSYKVQEWSRYQIDSELKTQHIARFSGILHDALCRRIIELWMEQLGEPPLPFCWLELGSYARQEQVLRTDQDYAIIYESDDRNIRQWYMVLASNVSKTLIECGYSKDESGIGADSESWCMSLEEWKMCCRKWIEIPEKKNILSSSIFFDFRPVYGKQKLAFALREFINSSKKEVFLKHLAADALTTPSPTGFFQKFILEKDGSHKDAFDLKLRALLPLVDIARILALESQLSVQNSVLRFQEFGKIHPDQMKRMNAASSALNYLLQIRFQSGFQNDDSGRFIPIQQLDKLQRQQLRNIFQLIEELQDFIKLRYQTQLLG
jgi:CBS domain-containing protein